MNTAVILILCFLGTFSGQDTPAQEDVPKLQPADVVKLLLFEIDDLEMNEIIITEIRQLEDMAKADVKIRGKEISLRLVCKMTDFGPKWRLADALDPALFATESESTVPEDIPTAKEPVQNTVRAAETARQKPVTTGMDIPPADRTAADYRNFVSGFLDILHTGTDTEFAAFYYQDVDFDYSKARANAEQASLRVKRRRRGFVRKCSEVSASLAAYQSIKAISFTDTAVPDNIMSQVTNLMPGATEYLAKVVVEFETEAGLGSITLEALTFINGQWRIGGIEQTRLP